MALDLLSPHAGGAARASGAAAGAASPAIGEPSAPRPLPDGYRLSQRHADQQLDVIHDFLTHSYWSPGIARERVETAVRNSLVAGAFDAGGRQVGLARLITDHASFGYLADVFVLEAHRGRGLATAMVRSLMDLPEVRDMRHLLLATRDAHNVYARLGWSPLADPSRWMEI
jgi:GNAT superfamily N-acetyltransferase